MTQTNSMDAKTRYSSAASKKHTLTSRINITSVYKDGNNISPAIGTKNQGSVSIVKPNKLDFSQN